MFFDFHCHPSFKTFLSNRQQALRKDCWSIFNFDLDFNILDSQASLSQIEDPQGRLIVCALYGLESGFAGSGLIKLAAGLSPHVEKKISTGNPMGRMGLQSIDDGRLAASYAQ